MPSSQDQNDIASATEFSASSRNIVDATSLLSAQQDSELLETLRPLGNVDSTEMPGPSHQAIEVLQTPGPSHQDANLQTPTHIQFAFTVTPEDISACHNLL
ncbi:hypothetical protein QE152_g8642 [Popillia japonica]|uniref:Uncharacterized protein n=1 Tax=Popillia japonica TaxID=7064 RepID=A0AAW1M1V1_POPJA